MWTRDFVLSFGINFLVPVVFYLLMTSMALHAVDRFQAADSMVGLAPDSFVVGSLLARLFAGRLLDVVGATPDADRLAGGLHRGGDCRHPQPEPVAAAGAAPGARHGLRGRQHRADRPGDALLGDRILGIITFLSSYARDFDVVGAASLFSIVYVGATLASRMILGRSRTPSATTP